MQEIILASVSSQCVLRCRHQDTSEVNARLLGQARFWRRGMSVWSGLVRAQKRNPPTHAVRHQKYQKYRAPNLQQHDGDGNWRHHGAVRSSVVSGQCGKEREIEVEKSPPAPASRRPDSNVGRACRDSAARE